MVIFIATRTTASSITTSQEQDPECCLDAVVLKRETQLRKMAEGSRLFPESSCRDLMVRHHERSCSSVR